MIINMAALQDGLVVLSVGFFVVFAFLSVMIFAMSVMEKVVAYLNKCFPVAVPAQAPLKASSNQDEEIAVAIAACLMKKYN